MFQHQLKIFILKTILNLDKFFDFYFPHILSFIFLNKPMEKKKTTQHLKGRGDFPVTENPGKSYARIWISYFSNPVQKVAHGNSGEEALGHTALSSQEGAWLRHSGESTFLFSVWISLQDTSLNLELCCYHQWTRPCNVYCNTQQHRHWHACNKQNTVYLDFQSMQYPHKNCR